MASAASFRSMLGLQPTIATTSDSVLIIIDAQNEYSDGKLAVRDVASSRRAIKSLLDKYRAGDGKVVHVKHATPEGAPVFTPGTRLAEEFGELAPRDGEKVVLKKFPGSFAETSLGDDLQEFARNKLVLAGYMAHVCVSTTAREAHQLGYEVVIPEDAIGDRDIPGATGDEVKQMVLHELGDFFGTVVKSEDIK